MQSILVVDDEQGVREAIVRVLSRAGFNVSSAENAQAALELLRTGEQFNAILTDLEMPGIKGIDFLRLVRERDLDVPVIILTGNPTLESAMSAVQYGGFRYLAKPFQNEQIVEIARSAAGMHRLAVLKRRALELCEAGAWLIGDAAGLDAHFDRAMSELWIAFQPIIRWPDQVVYGYEALVRSTEPTLSNPGLLFEAAERLGRVQELGRAIRSAVSNCIPSAPKESTIFVNLHSADLGDDELFAERSPLSGHAGRVVLEVTERASLHRISNLRGRIENLRRLGFQIAVDDLGAGYAGLSSFQPARAGHRQARYVTDPRHRRVGAQGQHRSLDDLGLPEGAGDDRGLRRRGNQGRARHARVARGRSAAGLPVRSAGAPVPAHEHLRAG